MRIFRPGRIVQKVRKNGVCYGPCYKITLCRKDFVYATRLENPKEEVTLQKNSIVRVNVIPIKVNTVLAKLLYVKAVRNESVNGHTYSSPKSKLWERFLSDDPKLALFYSGDGLYKAYASIDKALEHVSLGKQHIQITIKHLYTT